MPRDHPDWAMLLIDAVKRPGVISTAYSQFWNYSVGNQLLALFQCLTRKLEPGPINTFIGWRELGRHVKKGEKALTLCMPVSVKVKPAKAHSEQEVEPQRAVRFIYRDRWFVLSQTDGKSYEPTIVPEWNEQLALECLSIQRRALDHLNGNAQGFASADGIAISPIASLPHKTLFHELAHAVLGHCEKRVAEKTIVP